MSSRAPIGATRQSAAAPEFSLGLAGTVLKARYRVNAVSSMNRDVVLYTAEDVRQGRPIALKVVRDEFAADAAFVAALRTQADALAASAHVLRGVQRVYDFGVTETGQFFVALEWAEGATLRQVLDSGGALAEATALRVAIRVGEALEALHHHRLFHGHVGLDSVLMVTDGERIRLVGAELAAAYCTPTGLRLGAGFSLAYRAPEQVHLGETTAASDIYALGMLLRDLLTTGRAAQAPDAPPAPPLSPALERIIATALEARPDRRYQDISVMVNDIWGVTAVLPEPDSRPRSVKARGNPRRRVRRRRAPFTLRITAAAATACVVAAVVWVTGFDRITSQLSYIYSRVTLPSVTAVPVEHVASPPSVPSLMPDSREPTPARVDVKSVGDEPIASPRAPVDDVAATPAIDRPLPLVPQPVGARERPVAEPRAPLERAPIESRIPVEPRAAVPPRAVIEPPAVEPRAVGPKATVEPRAGVEPRATIEPRAPIAPRAPIEPRAAQPPAEHRAPAAPPARAERRDAEDGSAIIDWLLKDRR